MKCPVCNTDNASDLAFCQGCGRKIPRCPTCGVELTTRDRFCTYDGTRLSDDLLMLVPEEAVLTAPVWTRTGNETPDGNVPSVTTGPAVTTQTPPEQPRKAFCEACGKRIAPGNRFCAECQAKQKETKTGNKGKTLKVILIIALILALLAGLFAGGYAIVNSDLFAWGSSSERNEKEEREDKDDEDEDEDDDDDDDEAPVIDNAQEEQPSEVSPETEPATEAVEDPVETTPATEETTAATVPVSDPLMYWIENCDKMYLSMDDLAGFDAQSCVYARNACYAKSGRMFNSVELQNYFSQFDWYNPMISPDRFTGSMLNAYQNANINLVLEYERSHGYN